MRINVPGRREGTDEGWVRDKAKELYGVESIKVGHSGWPDRLYLTKPPGLWIEHKRYSGTEAMARQAWRIKRLNDLGYDARVIDDRDEALRAISEKVDPAQVPEKRPQTPARKRRVPHAGQPRSRQD
jgi:hypothetical protein